MSYTVRLDNFSGPLDLLLHLIKQEEVEIHEIPIRVICDRYFEYLKALEFLDVDVSSEFLVMASTLMLIKSRALLPADEEIDLEEELNPEDELIQQLLEYKQYKVASRDLSEMAEGRAHIYPFAPARIEAGEREIELEDIDLWDLVSAFSTILQETGIGRMPRLLKSEKPLRAFVEEVFATVRHRKRLVFRELFEGAQDRETVIGRFIALLELVRRKRVTVAQAACYDGIEIEIADDRELSEAEIDELEVEFEPEPDEEAGPDEAAEDVPIASEPEPEMVADPPDATAPVRPRGQRREGSGEQGLSAML